MTAKSKAKFGGAQPGAGRPGHEPTAKDREYVKGLCGLGVPDYEIAKMVGVSMPTLRKYYWQELETGHLITNSNVAKTLYKVATDPTNPKCVTAAIFWLKARAGWREAQAVEPLGKKDMAQMEAETSHQGTSWDALLPTPHSVQ